MLRDHRTLTGQQFIDAAMSIKLFFATDMGYNTVSFNNVLVGEHSAVAEFYLMDDFQAELDYGKRYMTGAQRVDICNMTDELRAWPSREMRELAITAQMMKALDTCGEQFASEQSRAFLTKLMRNVGKVDFALEDLRNRRRPLPQTIERFGA